MEELSYSLHLSNDKNKSIKARQEAKNTPSGTTSKNNNAIQNVKQLGKVNHHNLRLYDNKQELIKNIKGSNDITKDVKELYLDLFEDARLEYNNKQTRDDRKIDNYFNKIANDTKHDLACEIVIELGNMEYWDEKSLEYKYQMTQVFEQQIEDLKVIVPDFYVANATIHFDEHSPHLHIVGVPVKENCKTGLSRQVGKTSIFTKESLVIIQDKMRENMKKSLNNIRYQGVDEILLLTGDIEDQASIVASKVGVDGYEAELLPEDKAKTILKLQSKNSKVIMVGDGINDAPALAYADVGVSLGGGCTDAAIETSDVVIQTDDPMALPAVMNLSKKTMKVVKENFGLVIGINTLGLVFSAAGVLPVFWGAVLHNSSTIFVVSNSIRLLFSKIENKR